MEKISEALCKIVRDETREKIFPLLASIRDMRSEEKGGTKRKTHKKKNIHIKKQTHPRNHKKPKRKTTIKRKKVNKKKYTRENR